MKLNKSKFSQLPDFPHFTVGVGLILCNLSIGTPWYYGNLSIYTDSYFFHKVGIKDHPSASLWLIALFSIMSKVPLVMCGILAKKVGLWFSVVLGALSFNFATFLTFFFIQHLHHAFWPMTVALGVLGGFSSGIIQGTSMIYVTTWFPHNVGVATAFVGSAYAGGPLLINALITLYINPMNKTPDLHTYTSTYFTDQDIVSRVPYSLLLLACASSACHIVGVVLLKAYTCYSTLDSTDNSLDGSSSPPETDYNYERLQEPKEGDSILRSILPKGKVAQAFHESLDKELAPPEAHGESQSGQELTTRQMLKTRLFYKMAFMVMPTLMGTNVVINMYKQFGMAYFHDDFFLTSVGVLVNITVCVFRVIWGFIIKAIGPQKSIVILFAMTNVTYIFWFFTPMVSKWLFLFWTLLLQANQNGLYIIVSVLTLEYFGNSNYMTNFGVILTSSGSVAFGTPPLAAAFLLTFGYFWLYLLVTALSCVSLCLALTLPPTRA